MAVTQADVARRAGVSQRTVSNVVNEYPHISPEVLRRVTEAIEELGYRPSHAARSLRSGKSGVLLLIVPEIAVPYFAELAHIIVRDAEHSGLRVNVAESFGDWARARDLVEGAETHAIEGVILSPVDTSVERLEQLRTNVPIVLIGDEGGRGVADYVGIDNAAAAETATAHLIEQGARRIAFLGTDAAHPIDTEGSPSMAGRRRAGYESAMRAGNLEIRADHVVSTAGYHRSDGYRAMSTLLEAGDLPDAVYAATDLLAIGAIRALADAGLESPRDVLLAANDGVEEGAFARPRLTTIIPNMGEIAHQAVHILAARASGELSGQAPRDVIVDFSLVVRESSIQSSMNEAGMLEKADGYGR